MDTIAGYSSMLKTSQVESDIIIEFLVTKPNTAEIKLRATTNALGVAEVELFGYNTKQTGVYKVQAKRTTESQYGNQSIFKVFADGLDVNQSQIKANESSIAADGNAKAYITVVLNDKYRNAIKGHQVRLISSRAEDQVNLISGMTSDEQGRSVFEVSSKYPGISIYSALDVNLGLNLSERTKLIYFTPTELEIPRGGDFLQGDLFALGETAADVQTVASGPVHHFEISISDKIIAGDAQTIKITAKDVDNNVAKNYVGTILFATPDDENSTMPAEDGEFTFTDKDQGEFTFNLALTLTKLGSQTLQVYDKEDWDIMGEIKVEVIEKNAGSEQPTTVGDLKITTPSHGTELSSSTVSVLGKAEEYQEIKIFDNDVKIGETQADSEGMFSYLAQNMSDGIHNLYIKGGETVSNTVTITIDASPAVIDVFEITPAGEIERGSTYTIKVFSEPDLSAARIILSGITEDLQESSQTSGLYEVTLTAPEVGGEYPLDVVLVDSLGNKGEYLKRGTLRVKKEEIYRVPKVTGLRALADDKKVDLTWDAITEHTLPIVKYRLYYGLSAESIDQVIETL